MKPMSEGKASEGWYSLSGIYERFNCVGSVTSSIFISFHFYGL